MNLKRKKKRYLMRKLDGFRCLTHKKKLFRQKKVYKVYLVRGIWLP